MQVYTGKLSGGRPERRQGLRVVLDVTEGLHGSNVTCYNYFTSYELARQLLESKITVVGTLWKNKPEHPTGSCRRMTARWPLVVFHNILNAFVIWREINSDWMPGKRNKRRVFLQELGKALVTPFITRRERIRRTEASAARRHPPHGGIRPVVRAVKATTAAAQRALYPGGARPKCPASSVALAAAAPLGASKRKRCQMCHRKKDCKTHIVCRGYNKYICKGCSLVYCPTCWS